MGRMYDNYRMFPITNFKYKPNVERYVDGWKYIMTNVYGAGLPSNQEEAQTLMDKYVVHSDFLKKVENI